MCCRPPCSFHIKAHQPLHVQHPTHYPMVNPHPVYLACLHLGPGHYDAVIPDDADKNEWPALLLYLQLLQHSVIVDAKVLQETHVHSHWCTTNVDAHAIIVSNHARTITSVNSGGLRRTHCAKLIEFMKYGIRLRARAPPNWAARRISRWRDRAIAQCKRLWINYKCARTVFIGRSWLNPPAAHHVMLTTPTMLATYGRLWPADIALPSVESKCGPWNLLGFVRLALEVQAR